jgi:hypothetical protein
MPIYAWFDLWRLTVHQLKDKEANTWPTNGFCTASCHKAKEKGHFNVRSYVQGVTK